MFGKAYNNEVNLEVRKCLIFSHNITYITSNY
jgi:hypothetical protein